MTSIDVAPYNRKFDKQRGNVLTRQMFVPECSKLTTIVSGPSEKAIAFAPTNEVDRELSDLLGLVGGAFIKNRESSDHVCDHIPLTFVISERGENIKIAVFVKSIDYEPDRSAHPEAFFKDNYGHQLGMRTMLVYGWYVYVSKEQDSGLKKEDLRKLTLLPCMFTYDPRGHGNSGSRGNFATILKERPLPSTQVISSLEALRAILSDHYTSCFVESYAPDRKTRWGYLSSRYNHDNSLLELRALDGGDGVWKFERPQGNSLGLYLFGVVRAKDNYDITLAGDVTLSSDGVIFHSYYLSRIEKIEELKQLGIQNPSEEFLNDGYYFNRFYPRGSRRVPLEVVLAFSQQMPEDFKN